MDRFGNRGSDNFPKFNALPKFAQPSIVLGRKQSKKPRTRRVVVQIITERAEDALVRIANAQTLDEAVSIAITALLDNVEE